jgi:hypothetical protein
LVLLVMTVHAQVDVKLEFDQNKFLTGETSEVILRVANFTGSPLRLGERPDWLQFSVEMSRVWALPVLPTWKKLGLSR